MKLYNTIFSIENGGQAVYLLLLDASKAFDKVSYENYFNCYWLAMCVQKLKNYCTIARIKNVMSDGIMNTRILFLYQME